MPLKYDELVPVPDAFSGPTIPVDVQPADKRIEPGRIRTFTSGATRDTDEGKYDYEGFLSHRVLERYAEYMHKHRKQSDGTLRASDNWQKGIPMQQYIKSLFRHFMEAWGVWRSDYFLASGERKDDTKVGQVSYEILEEALCGILFNAMGFLHEVLRGR